MSLRPLSSRDTRMELAAGWRDVCSPANAVYRSILVPTDGSACSERAERHAVELAKAADATVVFLFVMDTVENYWEGGMSDVRRKLSAAGHQALARARSMAAQEGVQAETEILDGSPVEVILERAEDFDLVLMASHGKGLWKRLTVGSVTQAVLHRLTRPLLLVPCFDTPPAR
ncbi:MAG: universal stress protein [Polyangiaceae bacterium]